MDRIVHGLDCPCIVLAVGGKRCLLVVRSWMDPAVWADAVIGMDGREHNVNQRQDSSKAPSRVHTTVETVCVVAKEPLSFISKV